MKKELAKLTSSCNVDEFSEIIAVVEYSTNIEDENTVPEMKKDLNNIQEATPLSSHTIFHNIYKKDKLKIEQSGVATTTETGLIEGIEQELDVDINFT